MPHKTLYIDVDEEITSIIDRVRKAQANEVIVVVPKQAMLIQSLVNLKLLKKEADRRRKKIMIVTQDRIGKKLIEKAGILVQKNAEKTKADAPEQKPLAPRKELKSDLRNQFEENNQPEEETIGSNEYFSKPVPLASAGIPEAQEIKELKFGVSPEIPAKNRNDEKKFSKGEAPENSKIIEENKVSMSDIVAGPKNKLKKEKKRKVSQVFAPVRKELDGKASGHYVARESERQRKLSTEKLFDFSPEPIQPRQSQRKEKKVSPNQTKGKFGKYFLLVVLALAVIFSAALVYLLLSRATIVIQMKSPVPSVSKNILADVSAKAADQESATIPAVLEKISIEKSAQFNATGSSAGGAKAQGKVVVYNEFSSENQPLVATTRLETPDGKIFRITKDIIVPGLTQVAGEVKPGAIEVDVQADQPGSAYNLDPGSFKIVGFKGGPKYEKIYAVSTKPMTGGTNGENSVVSSDDLTRAKNDLADQAKKDAAEKLHSSLGPGRKFFDGAVQVNISDFSSTEKVGAQTATFSARISAQAQVISYLEADVKKIIDASQSAESLSGQKSDIPATISYSLTDSNLGDQKVKFEATANFANSNTLDTLSLKKEMLGKSKAEIKSLLENQPAVQSSEVSFWPFFVTHTPRNENRLKIEIR